MERCRPSIPGQRPEGRGFTLIELVLVLFIIGVVLALSFPMFRNLGGGDLRHEARTIIGCFQGLYSEATFTRKVYRLVFDMDEQRYWAEVKQGDSFAPVDHSLLRPVELPRNVRVADVVTPADGKRDTGKTYVNFYPLGRVDYTVLHLAGQGEEKLTLKANPVTGRVTVLNGYVEPGSE